MREQFNSHHITLDDFFTYQVVSESSKLISSQIVRQLFG